MHAFCNIARSYKDCMCMQDTAYGCCICLYKYIQMSYVQDFWTVQELGCARLCMQDFRISCKILGCARLCMQDFRIQCKIFGLCKNLVTVQDHACKIRANICTYPAGSCSKAAKFLADNTRLARMPLYICKIFYKLFKNLQAK